VSLQGCTGPGAELVRAAVLRWPQTRRGRLHAQQRAVWHHGGSRTDDFGLTLHSIAQRHGPARTARADARRTGGASGRQGRQGRREGQGGGRHGNRRRWAMTPSRHASPLGLVCVRRALERGECREGMSWSRLQIQRERSRCKPWPARSAARERQRRSCKPCWPARSVSRRVERAAACSVRAGRA